MDHNKLTTHIFIYILILLILGISNIAIKIVARSKMAPRKFWGFREFFLIFLYFIYIILYAEFIDNIFDVIMMPFEHNGIAYSLLVILLKIPYFIVYAMIYFSLFNVSFNKKLGKIKYTIKYSIVMFSFMIISWIWGILGALHHIVNMIF